MELVRIGRPSSRFKVLATCDARGDCPVLDFLEKLDKSEAKLRNAVLAFLRERVAEHGPPTYEEQCRELKDNIFEFKKGPIRILWFWDVDQMILCTHAFRKKTQKTPPGEIDRAKLVRDNYQVAKQDKNLAIR
jgi:phage-related protein